jgi:hypothetical protein
MDFSTFFGGPAGVAHVGDLTWAVAPWLCVAAFRRVCYFGGALRRGNAVGRSARAGHQAHTRARPGRAGCIPLTASCENPRQPTVSAIYCKHPETIRRGDSRRSLRNARPSEVLPRQRFRVVDEASAALARRAHPPHASASTRLSSISRHRCMSGTTFIGKKLID